MVIKRSTAIYIILISLIIALLFRIYYISFGNINLKVKAVAGGRESIFTVYNSKGIIYDRNLQPISGNKHIYYLIVNPKGFDKSQLNYISQISNTEISTLSEKLNKKSIFVLKSNLHPKEVNGVYIIEGTCRYDDSYFSEHLLGYLDSDQIVGLSGIEKAFNDELSIFSSSFSASFKTNAIRGAINGLGITKLSNETESTNGVVLTLDEQLSLYAKELMENWISEGAVIVMNANNGDILTMLSTPEFDPEKVADYMYSNGGELINNAVTNQTVGSVFKMVVAACSVINKTESFTYECHGGIEIGGRIFGCQNKDGHGIMNLDDAFSFSCNSYFIALGQILGYDKIIETSQLFGIDSKLKLCKEIFSSAGVLPDESGTQSVANLSIGQGELMISPLQIARITATLCNGGYLVNPNIYNGMYIDEELSFSGQYKYRNRVLTDYEAGLLKEICINCVENGTGKTAKPQKGGAGGKTASAQTGKFDKNGKEILNTYFTGFYPADNPEYVITVFAKNGKSGSSTCAPIFRDICDYLCENY